MSLTLLFILEYNPLFRSNKYCYQAKLESLANWYNALLNIKVGNGVNKGLTLKQNNFVMY